MKLALAADPAVQKTAAGAAAAAGAASWIAIAADWALQLFGVPLPVVLASAAGAFLARTMLPVGAPGRAVGTFFAWTLIGAFGADLAHVGLASWMGKELPTGAVAGSAALVALAGSVLLTSDMVGKARAAIGRWLDSKWRDISGTGSDKGGGNGS